MGEKQSHFIIKNEMISILNRFFSTGSEDMFDVSGRNAVIMISFDSSCEKKQALHLFLRNQKKVLTF